MTTSAPEASRPEASPLESLRHVEDDYERRLTLGFAVNPQAIQALLPPSWTTAPMAAGPSAGANLLLAFRNRLHTVHYDAAGAPAAGTPEHGVIFLASAINPATRQPALRVVSTLSADPGGVPGAYSNAVLVKVDMKQDFAVSSGTQSVADEKWTVTASDGGTLTLHVRYGVGIPNDSDTRITMFGGPDPDFYRVYRTQKGSDVILSVAERRDKVDAYEFHACMKQLSALFDGSEQLRSIVADPWYHRQVFLPVTASPAL